MRISQAEFLVMQARCDAARNVVLNPGARVGESKESDLHNKIIEACKARGWIYFHGSMVVKSSRTIGEPDFTILADKGRVFFVECKTKTGKLSPEQLGIKMWAEKLGHTIHVVRSMEEFLEAVK